MFSFPKDEIMLKKSLRAIPRVHLQPKKYSKVCERHFTQESIIRVSKYYDEKSGKALEVPLKYPKMTSGCITTIFQNCSAYISKYNVLTRKSRDEKNIIYFYSFISYCLRYALSC